MGSEKPGDGFRDLLGPTDDQRQGAICSPAGSGDITVFGFKNIFLGVSCFQLRLILPAVTAIGIRLRHAS